MNNRVRPNAPRSLPQLPIRLIIGRGMLPKSSLNEGVDPANDAIWAIVYVAGSYRDGQRQHLPPALDLQSVDILSGEKR